MVTEGKSSFRFHLIIGKAQMAGIKILRSDHRVFIDPQSQHRTVLSRRRESRMILHAQVLLEPNQFDVL